MRKDYTKFNWKPYLIATILTLILAIIYFTSKYEMVDNRINSIEVSLKTNSKLNNVYLYITNTKDIDFNRSYQVRRINDTLFTAHFDNDIKIRKFRIYFHDSIQNIVLNKISYQSGKSINISKCKIGNSLEIDENFRVSSLSGNGYIESPYFFYHEDQISVIYIFLLLLIAIALISPILNVSVVDIKSNKIASLSIVAFVFSIYLPHPVFNILFIISLLFLIREFDFNFFLSQKINLLFLAFFLVLMLNDFFISKEGYMNLTATETYLPFLLLPVYASCIKRDDFLYYFPKSAIILGYGFVVTSLVDVTILRDIELISFDYFSKFLSPIYFSYLLSFSILYVLLNNNGLRKLYLVIILFFLLVLCASKLIVVITILLFLVFSSSKRLILSGIAGFILILFLFSPIRERYLSIMSIEDFNIVKEKHIVNSNDKRINGLTFRLMLWEEAILATTSFKSIMFGNGVGPTSRKIYEQKIIDRGLINHKGFMPHNQFIETFYKTGLTGLFVLLSILSYSFYLAIKTKNKLFLIVTIILTASMMSESVFERVRGIYFFSTVILFLANSPYDNGSKNKIYK